MGFRVSVTGGLDVDTLKLFEGVDVFTFIAGRGITEAADPAGAARAFRMKSDEFGGKPWHVQLEFMKRQPDTLYLARTFKFCQGVRL